MYLNHNSNYYIISYIYILYLNISLFDDDVDKHDNFFIYYHNSIPYL